MSDVNEEVFSAQPGPFQNDEDEVDSGRMNAFAIINKINNIETTVKAIEQKMTLWVLTTAFFLFFCFMSIIEKGIDNGRCNPTSLIYFCFINLLLSVIYVLCYLHVQQQSKVINFPVLMFKCSCWILH